MFDPELRATVVDDADILKAGIELLGRFGKYAVPLFIQLLNDEERGGN